ncbi:hypothetical protein MLD38_018148 [Melastoma candidum]|uniref:Uncharacterized protein n=1 Tax=Melastoma candidum TaxID=119954 RepID=A0ACB9QT39_9MYRT|nr:hypothetical protein MLD38_018148 [Melastoma candidum]
MALSFDRDAFVEELLDISSSSSPAVAEVVGPDDDGPSMEEELEWISNMDAFPSLETFFHSPLPRDEILGSPVSVLENSSLTLSGDCTSYVHNGRVRWTSMTTGRRSVRVPVKARSKSARKRRRNVFGKFPASRAKVPRRDPGKGTVGHKCLHCGAEKTPQWRAGPHGPKTLCNACGVRYKSGRLVPEYRPVSSPTFSSQLHSNSHGKIMEMRRVKGGV